MINIKAILSTPGHSAISTYHNRFGGLLKAYELVGYKPPSDFAYVETYRRFAEIKRHTVSVLLRGSAAHGVTVQRHDQPVLIGGRWRLEVAVARCIHTRRDELRWDMLPPNESTKFFVAVRMEPGNREVSGLVLFAELRRNPSRFRLDAVEMEHMAAVRGDSAAIVGAIVDALNRRQSTV